MSMIHVREIAREHREMFKTRTLLHKIIEESGESQQAIGKYLEDPSHENRSHMQLELVQLYILLIWYMYSLSLSRAQELLTAEMKRLMNRFGFPQKLNLDNTKSYVIEHTYSLYLMITPDKQKKK